MINRQLQLDSLLKRKGVLLLGPRMTGKSTLLRTALPGATVIDLLDPTEFRTLAAYPETLVQRVAAMEARSRYVVIDEVQKVPALLDVVHSLIERDKSLRFVLTGSSARKLRRGDVNLLAGRLARAELFPIVSAELPASVPLERLMTIGGLPFVLTAEDPFAELGDYVGTYLKEEILAEGFSRNIGAFARFLDVAALSNGELVVFSNIASDAALPVRTVQDHFQLLEDTLLGEILPAFRKSKRKSVATGKFYFFDPGIANFMLGRRNLAPRTPEYGRAFEHLIYCELRAHLSYARLSHSLCHFRTTTGSEVDFVVDRTSGPLAIIAKAKTRVTEQDLAGIRAFKTEFKKASCYVVCEEATARTTEDAIHIVPIATFFNRLWHAGADAL
jgi:uncharacterized protein